MKKLLLILIFVLILIRAQAAAPTNPPTASRVSVTVTTGSVLVGLGTNVFWTNIALIRQAGIVAPTNSPTPGFVPIATAGSQTTWGFAPQPSSGNLSNWSTLNTNVLDGSGGSTNAWLVGGNTGSSGTVLGLVNDSPFKLLHNNLQVGLMETEYSGQHPSITLGLYGTNVTSPGGVIGGGASNLIYGYQPHSVIAGGRSNTLAGATNSGFAVFLGGSVIGGGIHNSIADGALGLAGQNVIAGGIGNAIWGYRNMIGGGAGNIITQGGGGYSVIVGGLNNIITSNSYAFIGGGLENKTTNYYGTVEPAYHTIAGGYRNVAGGQYATIPGGGSNTAYGIASLAAGWRANASNHYTFVWNDGLNPVCTTDTNQFLIYAAKGVGINTNNPATNALQVVGNVDSTVGFTVNGVPLASSASIPYRVFASTNLISNTGAAETNLYSFTIPANTLSNVYQTVEYWVHGGVPAGNTAGLAVYLNTAGAATLISSNWFLDGGSWVLRGRIMCLTASTVRSSHDLLCGQADLVPDQNTVESVNYDQDKVIGLETNNTLLIRGTASSSSIISVKMAKGMWQP